MSPGNRGPKDAESGRRPSSTPSGTDPNQAADAPRASRPGPSTQTVPPEGRMSPRRRKASPDPGGVARQQGDGARSQKRRPTDAERQGPARKAEDDDIAADAWADYEEDANDWVLTDEHSIIGDKPGSKSVLGRTTGIESPGPSAQTPAFDPSEHAVPRGPSYDPVVDLGSFEGLGGTDAGKRWPITATMLATGRVRLGRGVDNDVVLTDASISRAHAELRRTGEAWTLVDLQSGNGSFVGGARVQQSAIEPGQTLGLGSGTYRLMLPGSVALEPLARVTSGPSAWTAPPSFKSPPPKDAPDGKAAARESKGVSAHQATWVLPRVVTQGPSWVRTTLLGAGVAASLAAAMGGWHMLRVWDVVGPLHTAMFEHYLDGVDALNAHKWGEAEAAFAAVMEADPNSIRGQRYLAAAIAGRSDEAKLQEAQTALGAQDWSKAYRLAAELEPGLFHAPSRIIVQQIQAHVTGRVIEALAALEAGETKKAQTLLVEADTIMPHRPDVALLRTRANSTLGLAGGSSPPPMGPVTLVKSSRRSARRKTPVGGASAARGDAALGPAIAAFNEGNADEALSELKAQGSSSASAMAQNVRAFVRVYNAGLAEHRNKRAFAAVQALNQAKVLGAKIGGGQGQLAGQIDVKLADMYYVMGMQAYAGGKFGEAAEAWRQALEHVPEHALSKSKLEELDQKARAMIDEAEALKTQDTEKAKSLLRDVAQMVAPGGLTAMRAQRIAAQMP